jgi:hypothetical protein
MSTNGTFVCNVCDDGLEWMSDFYMCMAPPVVCMKDCIICTTADVCDMCSIGFVYNDANSVCEMDNACPEGQFLNTIVEVCEDCTADCRVCGDSLICSECNEGFEWDSNTWSCKREEIECIENCLTCSDKYSCDFCAPTYVYNEDTYTCEMD